MAKWTDRRTSFVKNFFNSVDTHTRKNLFFGSHQKHGKSQTLRFWFSPNLHPLDQLFKEQKVLIFYIGHSWREIFDMGCPMCLENQNCQMTNESTTTMGYLPEWANQEWGMQEHVFGTQMQPQLWSLGPAGKNLLNRKVWCSHTHRLINLAHSILPFFFIEYLHICVLEKLNLITECNISIRNERKLIQQKYLAIVRLSSHIQLAWYWYRTFNKVKNERTWGWVNRRENKPMSVDWKIMRRVVFWWKEWRLISILASLDIRRRLERVNMSRCSSRMSRMFLCFSKCSISIDIFHSAIIRNSFGNIKSNVLSRNIDFHIFRHRNKPRH